MTKFKSTGPLQRFVMASALSGLMLLGGCVEPTAPTDTLTKESASRFLHQATFGATQEDIDHLMTVGYEAWITEQFAETPSDNYWDFVDRGGPPACQTCNALGTGAVQEAFWYQAIEGKAQLRQRVEFALSELFVTSALNNSVLLDYSLSQAAFHTMLMDNALGNFRDILEKVALHPAMGVYLSHLQNEKEDPATGRLPDENFARELMQLFTIGKWMLYQDGTLQKDADGNYIPTYTQADIMGMAKVFTGWSWGGADTDERRWYGYNIGAATTQRWDLPMQPYPNHHSTSEQHILGGVVIPANTSAQASVKIALDTLFNHPNLPPFIASHLIKRLVTSNPSKAYVTRVANVFMQSDKGVRGDMRAVVRAILFDPEARDITKLNDPTWGKLREPVIRIANYFRAFHSRSPLHEYVYGPLEVTPFDIGQTPWNPPTVFNFFRPDYQPPGVVADNNLVAPEFQILDEATAAGYVNFMERGIEFYFGSDTNKAVPDYSAELALANDPTALVNRVVMLLNGGYLSPETRALIENSVKSIDLAGTDAALRRVRTAIVLTLASPDYLIQK